MALPIVLLVIAIVIPFIGIYLERTKDECPNCGKHSWHKRHYLDECNSCSYQEPHYKK